MHSLNDITRTTLRCRRDWVWRGVFNRPTMPWQAFANEKPELIDFPDGTEKRIVNQMRVEGMQHVTKNQIVDRLASLVTEAEENLRRLNVEAWAWSQRDA